MPPARGAGTVAGSICKRPAIGLTVALLAVVQRGFGRESTRERSADGCGVGGTPAPLAGSIGGRFSGSDFAHFLSRCF